MTITEACFNYRGMATLTKSVILKGEAVQLRVLHGVVGTANGPIAYHPPASAMRLPIIFQLERRMTKAQLVIFQLERRKAVETTSLNPQHRFVPWVVVDNHALQDGTGLLIHRSVTTSSLPQNMSQVVISICFIAGFPEFRELHMQGLLG